MYLQYASLQLKNKAISIQTVNVAWVLTVTPKSGLIRTP